MVKHTTALKIIKGKEYELEGYYKTPAEANARAKNLEGRLHIFTGAITRTKVSKIPQRGKYSIYAVWKRKE